MKKAGMAFLVILIIALAGAGFVYFRDRAAQEAAQEAALREREAWEHKNQQLQKQLGALEKDMSKLNRELQASDQAPPLDQGKQQQVFGDNGTAQNQALGSVHDRIMKFFSYLDQKGYLASHGIQGTAYEHFGTIMGRLQQTTPVISGESQDMLTLLKNITFMFGVLGKNDTLLVRDIMIGESEVMEPTIKLFYDWLDPANAIAAPGRITVPFEKQYEYASFLLQTIGGKAYLFRRDMKTRQLATYYCLLVLDRANQDSLNKYGIDIRPLVNNLLTEMQGSKMLSNKQEYISNLKIIKQRSDGIKIERPNIDLPLESPGGEG